MLKLFHAPMSRSTRILQVLEETGLPYDVVYCDIPRRDGSGGRDPANRHPDGKVPALEHEGGIVSESPSVVLYLTDLAGKAEVGPQVGDPDRAAYLTWLFWSVGEMEPAFFHAYAGRLETDPHAKKQFDQFWGRLTGALAQGPWLLGDRFSAADVLIASAIGWLGSLLPEDANVKAWVARVQSRPSFAAAMAKDARPG